MASIPLTRDQRRHLVQLLAERAGILTPLQRENLLDDVGLAQFKSRLNFDTDSRTFASQLVRVLQDHGTLADTGQPALVSLLEELREIVSSQEDKAAFVDELLAPYRADTAHPTQPSPPAAQAGNTIRVLFLASNPARTTQLRLLEEMRTVEERLREASLRDRFDLRWGYAVRDSDLSRLLLQHRPHLVHFAGHGTRAGEAAAPEERCWGWFVLAFQRFRFQCFSQRVAAKFTPLGTIRIRAYSGCAGQSLPGQAARQAPGACCAAVRGTTTTGMRARPPATGTTRITGTTTTVSGSSWRPTSVRPVSGGTRHVPRVTPARVVASNNTG